MGTCVPTQPWWYMTADEDLPQYQAHLRDQGVSQRCQAMAISDMAVCYVDRSYSIKHGCCSGDAARAFVGCVTGQGMSCHSVIAHGCRDGSTKGRKTAAALSARHAIAKACRSRNPDGKQQATIGDGNT